MPGFLPRRDADLLKFVSQISRQLNEAPGEYGVGPERIEEYTQHILQFKAAMALVNDPNTCTHIAIVQKDQARDRAKLSTRSLSKTVRSNSQVSGAQLAMLGLRPLNRLRTRIARPSSAPILAIRDVHGSLITVRAKDADALHRTAKPRGVCSIAVWVFAGDEPSENQAHWFRIGDFTRTKFEIDVSRWTPPGGKIWIVARWTNPRQMHGPNSLPIYTHTQIGVLSKLPELRAAA